MVGLGDATGRANRTEAVFDRALGHPVVERLVRAVARAPLRVLAYHEIRDVAGFAEQMEHLSTRYQPVGSAEVIDWLEGGELAEQAAWVTFDDGDPSVVELGLPVLEEYGVPATMFICPGMIDTDQPFWWQVVEQLDPDEVGALKVAPNGVRAARTGEIARQLHDRDGVPYTRPQLSSTQLELWLRSGRDVGNHTWDHPMLDRCSAEEQVRQIRMAHEWIERRVGPDRLIFAYPNGNPSPASDAVLEELGYQATVMFDHRMANRTEPHRLSRLRTNADSDTARFRAIVSGAHPRLHHLLGRR